MKKLMFTVALMATMATFAQRPGGERPHREMMMGGGAPIMRMLMNPQMRKDLNLSKEQEDKLEQLNKSFRESNRDNQQKMHATMEKQSSLMQADKIDEASVMKVIDEVFEIRKAMAKEQVKREIAMKSLLTPEQLAKVKDKEKELRTSRRRPHRPAPAKAEKPAAEKSAEVK